MSDDDVALFAEAAKGDITSFDTLVRRHTAKLYRVALRILGDPADAEDVVQDAWVSAWRSMGQFRGESAPTTWLYRVVTNAALAQIRRRRPTVPLEPEGQAESSFADSGPTPEQAALRREKVDAVLHAIALLEPSQRVPLVLRELEGMSYEEVAAVLEVSVPALRSRLHRARVALLAKLEELR
ncbi:RNA polymerase sigma factor [Allokutzneria oryzae]|uniref:RNA polymerase sigma factor n=1 Tax=Allokutzneria oryzae TaxID=1378989 RepID=A0ABV6A5D4_9PSEU